MVRIGCPDPDGDGQMNEDGYGTLCVMRERASAVALSFFIQPCLQLSVVLQLVARARASQGGGGGRRRRRRCASARGAAGRVSG